MRLWHKDLIDVLPKNQLISQWRELSAITGAIIKNGTPNTILVNPVLNYDFDHFISYAYIVKFNILTRGYSVNDSVWDKICSLKPNYQIITKDKIFPDWHNMRYLKQCFYNLEEKFDRGGISMDEFYSIYHKMKLYETEI